MAGMTDAPDAPSIDFVLDAVTAEIEVYVSARGWDHAASLFALVETSTLVNDPDTAATLGLAGADAPAGSLTPVEQDELPAPDLDDALAQIAWPEEVVGCAVSQEIVLLPPDAEQDLPDGAEAVAIALAHPDRREARLVVSVRRDGSSSGILRLRGLEGEGDEVLYGSSLAANLVAALHATFD
jgi:hypothetical protein